MLALQDGPAHRAAWQDNVTFIGALPGCYALSERRDGDASAVPVYACRLVSISPLQATVVAPVVAAVGETVALHFKDFGILRATVVREQPTGFVLDLHLDEDARGKLAARIRWKKQNVQHHVPDKREHPRIQPRNPRTVLTLAGGTRHPCFVIDISQSGAALSAPVLPGKGTPLAVGTLIGRVVRRLDVGFAIEFIKIHPFEHLEELMAPPKN